MGVRFRKSKKIGPVRFTLSKSGLSTSIGVKGFRVTKTASGRLRTTASIPGTGISYVKETGGKAVQQRPIQEQAQIEAQRPYPTGYKPIRWWLAFVPGVFLVLGSAGNTTSSYTTVVILGAIGVVLTILGVVLMLKDRRRRAAADQAEQQARMEAMQKAEEERAAAAAKAEEERRIRDAAIAAARAEAAAKAEAERLEAAARRAEWERTHGRIVTAIAGVTFKNDDGSSRQALLKDIKARGGDADLELEEYDYKGKPAIRVLVDGEQIGNIPRGRVAEVSAVLEQLESARLEVETFRPEEEEDDDGNVRRRGELIYRADLTLVYAK